ncbi:uncharacterized protein LOC135812522 [Sycon ciliatum]|uniref:uncharacterized protein LOC135812522 n=1 Tax=Sycon ciliatum TaxID=27933 RepID=UPI0031F626A3
MLVQYANVFIRRGSTCQVDVTLKRGTYTRSVTSEHSCTKGGSCIRWIGLDTLPSNLRHQCPSPSRITVSIRPVVRDGVGSQCSVSADSHNRTIIRIFMEYTTEEEPPATASTTRRSVPTTSIGERTTSRYVLTTSVQGPIASRDISHRPTLDLNTETSTIKPLSAHLTYIDERVVTTLNAKSDSSSNSIHITPSSDSYTTRQSTKETVSTGRGNTNTNALSTLTVTAMAENQPSFFPSRGAIIGISVSVIVFGLLLGTVFLRRFRSSMCPAEGQNPPKCNKSVQSNSGYPDGPVRNTQEIAMYETVTNDASKYSEQSGATQDNNQSNVPMYESTAYVSITKKSCDLTESSVYRTNTDTN